MSFEFAFHLNRLEFLNILRRISLLSTERFKGVVLHLGEDALEATFTNPEVGEGREVIPLTLTRGDAAQLPMKVGFNARYLLEPLQIMEADTVILEMNDNEHPTRVMEEGDLNYFAIVMPWGL